jgi:ribokinase
MDLVARLARMPLAGESLHAESFAIVPGGKGNNQAIAAARLGAAVTLIGRTGEDGFGDEFARLLAAEGVDAAHVGRDPNEGTGIAVPLILPDGRNSIVVAPRANLRLTVADVERAADAIARASMLLLQHEVPPECNVAAARIAAEAGVPVLLNPAPAAPIPDDLLRRVSYLVPNEVEAAMLTGLPYADPETWGRRLLAPSMAAVIVTLGEQGAVCVTHDGGTFHQPAFEVEAIDTVGAGDAFCAAFAVRRAEGGSLAESVRFASAAAALAVTGHGATAPLPKRDAVERFLTTTDTAAGG